SSSVISSTATVPVDLAAARWEWLCRVTVVVPQGSAEGIDRALNGGGIWPGSLEHSGCLAVSLSSHERENESETKTGYGRPQPTRLGVWGVTYPGDSTRKIALELVHLILPSLCTSKFQMKRL